MDLLGSIMGSMDASKPPPQSEKERLKKKQQKEYAVKLEEKQRQAKQKFRTKIETNINDFLKRDNDKTLRFEPMDKYHRSVVHDVAEVAGLVTYSFGEEDVDRFSQVSYSRVRCPHNLILLGCRCGRKSSVLAKGSWRRCGGARSGTR